MMIMKRLINYVVLFPLALVIVLVLPVFVVLTYPFLGFRATLFLIAEFFKKMIEETEALNTEPYSRGIGTFMFKVSYMIYFVLYLPFLLYIALMDRSKRQ